MNLVWTKRAIIDRREIRVFIAKERPKAAITLDIRFSEVAKKLTEHPK